MIFIDESGFLMAPLVRRSWALRGQTPVLHQRIRCHKKVSAIAAISLSPRRHEVSLCFRLYPNLNIKDANVMEFLNQLLRHFRTKIVLLWDRLNAHRSSKMNRFLLKHRNRLIPYFLPPYAPELNPVENVWGYLKMNPLSNYPFDEIDPMAKTVRRFARQVQNDHDLLKSFIEHTPLSFLP